MSRPADTHNAGKAGQPDRARCVAVGQGEHKVPKAKVGRPHDAAVDTESVARCRRHTHQQVVKLPEAFGVLKSRDAHVRAISARGSRQPWPRGA